MAFVSDSNRPQPHRQPPPTACLTAFGAASVVPSLLMHPFPPPPGLFFHLTPSWLPRLDPPPQPPRKGALQGRGWGGTGFGTGWVRARAHLRCPVPAGTSSWLDFTNPTVRDWYATMFKYDKYKGSTPILYTWIDMNEVCGGGRAGPRGVGMEARGPAVSRHPPSHDRIKGLRAGPGGRASLLPH